MPSSEYTVNDAVGTEIEAFDHFPSQDLEVERHPCASLQRPT